MLKIFLGIIIGFLLTVSAIIYLNMRYEQERRSYRVYEFNVEKQTDLSEMP